MARGKFGEWLDGKFVWWQATEGGRRSMDEFANFLGFKRVTISRWINGARTPGEPEKIAKLADKLGNEIYSILELPRPHPTLQRMLREFDNLSEEALDNVERILDKEKAKRAQEKVLERASKP